MKSIVFLLVSLDEFLEQEALAALCLQLCLLVSCELGRVLVPQSLILNFRD